MLLVGDAVAGFRPYTAASTSQAAFDALKLEKLMQREISKDQWEKETMDYANYMQRRGVEMGQRSQFWASSARVDDRYGSTNEHNDLYRENYTKSILDAIAVQVGNHSKMIFIITISSTNSRTVKKISPF